MNIQDTGDLYAIVYNGALRDDIGHGKSGYYFGAPGEYTLLSVVQAVGSALVDLGYAEDAEPKTFDLEEIQKYFRGSYFSGTNSRAVNPRSTEIGWKPRYTEMEDVVKHLGEEIVRLERTYGRKWSR